MWANSSTFNYPDTTPGTAAAAALLPRDAQKLIITNSIAIWIYNWQRGRRLAVLCNLISDGHVLLWLSETILSFKNVNQHKPPHNNIYPVYHCACYDWEAVNKGLCCYHVTVPASCVLATATPGPNLPIIAQNVIITIWWSFLVSTRAHSPAVKTVCWSPPPQHGDCAIQHAARNILSINLFCIWLSHQICSQILTQQKFHNRAC